MFKQSTASFPTARLVAELSLPLGERIEMQTTYPGFKLVAGFISYKVDYQP